MKCKLLTLAGLFTLPFLLPPSLQAADVSKLYRPETDKANGEVIRNEDDTAWDGEYASHNKEYNPIFIAPTSDIQGDRIHIWARMRGYAVQVKAGMKGGAQVELGWTWDKPAEWKWLKLGSYDQEQLGESVIIIRGPDAAPNAGIDAVLLTSDPALDPSTLDHEALKAAVQATEKKSAPGDYR